MRGNNGLYLIIGALVVIVAVGGYYFYRAQHKTGIVEIGGKGISVQTN